MLHHGCDHPAVLGPEAHPADHLVDQTDAGLGVVTWVALAEVVHQCTHEQQVGAGHIAHELVGVGDRGQQVMVHRVGVEGVALRQAAHRPPLRYEAAEQAVALQRLDRRRQRLAGTEQADERPAGGLRPLLAGRGAPAGQHPQRPAAHRPACVGGCGGEAEHIGLLVHIRIGGDVRLLVQQQDAGREGDGRRRAGAPAGADQPLDPVPEPFRGPLDGVRRTGQVEHQRVGVGEAHGLGHTVLVLEEQDVDGAPRCPVQFATRGQQQLGRGGEVLDGALHRRRDFRAVDAQCPAEHVVVAQAPAAVLQVRLQQRGDRAEAGPPLLAGIQQALQPHVGTLAPLLQRRRVDAGGERGVPGEGAQQQDRGGRVQVVGRQLLQRLG